MRQRDAARCSMRLAQVSPALADEFERFRQDAADERIRANALLSEAWALYRQATEAADPDATLEEML